MDSSVDSTFDKIELIRENLAIKKTDNTILQLSLSFLVNFKTYAMIVDCSLNFLNMR